MVAVNSLTAHSDHVCFEKTLGMENCGQTGGKEGSGGENGIREGKGKERKEREGGW